VERGGDVAVESRHGLLRRLVGAGCIRLPLVGGWHYRVGWSFWTGIKRRPCGPSGWTGLETGHSVGEEHPPTTPSAWPPPWRRGTKRGEAKWGGGRNGDRHLFRDWGAEEDEAQLRRHVRSKTQFWNEETREAACQVLVGARGTRPECSLRCCVFWRPRRRGFRFSGLCEAELRGQGRCQAASRQGGISDVATREEGEFGARLVGRRKTKRSFGDTCVPKRSFGTRKNIPRPRLWRGHPLGEGGRRGTSGTGKNAVILRSIGVDRAGDGAQRGEEHPPTTPSAWPPPWRRGTKRGRRGLGRGRTRSKW